MPGASPGENPPPVGKSATAGGSAANRVQNLGMDHTAWPSSPGPSSGIGAATARALAREGYAVVCAARRRHRIEALAAEIGPCGDLRRPWLGPRPGRRGGRTPARPGEQCRRIGSEPVETADPQDWKAMYDVNVVGVLQVTQALLPALRASGDGLIVNVGRPPAGSPTRAEAATPPPSTARRRSRRRSGSSCAANPSGLPDAPGMVRTEEFSLVRFGGGPGHDAVYAGVPRPLVAEDVAADAIAWVATRPSHVNIDEPLTRPRAQAAQHARLRRRTAGRADDRTRGRHERRRAARRPPRRSTSSWSTARRMHLGRP